MTLAGGILFCLFATVLSHIAADDTALGVADEEDDLIAFLGCGQLGFYALHGVRIIKTREVEIAIGLLNVADGFIGEPAAAQTYGVDSDVGYRITTCLYVWRYILIDESTTLKHYMRPDVAELMDEGSAADDSVVVDHNLAGTLDCV